MVIQLTADQENLIESKLQTGQYQSPEEILQIAFRLFEKYEESDAEWLAETRVKVQEAYDEMAPSVDGPAFIRELRQKTDLLLRSKRRTASPLIAGLGKTIGDVVSPIVDEQDWECLKG